jgi:hypothetical protein
LRNENNSQKRPALHFRFCEKLLRSSNRQRFRRQSTNCGGFFVGLRLGGRLGALVVVLGVLVDVSSAHVKGIHPDRTSDLFPPNPTEADAAVLLTYERATKHAHDHNKARSSVGFRASTDGIESTRTRLRDQPEPHLQPRKQALAVQHPLLETTHRLGRNEPSTSMRRCGRTALSLSIKVLLMLRSSLRHATMERFQSSLYY